MLFVTVVLRGHERVKRLSLYLESVRFTDLLGRVVAPDKSLLTRQNLAHTAYAGTIRASVGAILLAFSSVDPLLGIGIFSVGFWLVLTVGHLIVGLAYFRSISYAASTLDREEYE